MKGKVLLIRLALLTCLMMLSPPTVLAGPLEGVFCNGNFDGDSDVDAEDVTEFLIHFGRSPFNDPCPPTPPLAAVPKTGQTACYDAIGTVIDCANTGQDGQYQMGISLPDGSARFTDNEDGTVTDKSTGLMWTRDANACGGEALPWEAIFDCANALNADTVYGYNDWRPANAAQLQSLLDYGHSSPALTPGHPFENVEYQLLSFWSSTTSDYDKSAAFTVNVGKDAYFAPRPKDWNYRGWMVREGFTRNNRFTDNNDGTVTDNTTGLVWLKDALCEWLNPLLAPRYWASATSRVDFLEAPFCGLNDGSTHGDWRLPTVGEWNDFKCCDYIPNVCNTAGDDGWVEGDPFINIQYGGVEDIYWTSTVYPEYDNYLATYLSIPPPRCWIAGRHFDDLGFVWPVRDP